MVGREVRVRLDECLALDERRDVVAHEAGNLREEGLEIREDSRGREPRDQGTAVRWARALER